MGVLDRPCVGPKRNEFEQWRHAHPRTDDADAIEARNAARPADIVHAELILGLMERFNYPNLAAVEAEDSRILYLLECESFGRKRDEEEELEEQKAQAELQRAEMEVNE